MVAQKELVSVLFADVDAGRLPKVCVATGRTATKTIQKTFVNAPAWPFVIAPFSFLAAFVGRIAGSNSIAVELPVASEVRRIRGISAREERGWLILRGVHPNFARAAGRFYADRADEIPIR